MTRNSHSPDAVARWDGRRTMWPNRRIIHFTPQQMELISRTRIKHNLRSEEAAIRMLVEMAGNLPDPPEQD